MSSSHFNEFIDYHVKDFKYKYEILSRNLYTSISPKELLHPGEFGTYREEICKSFIRPITPSYLGIENGFIFTKEGKISKQCDVIIYDTHVTPITPSFKKFFPIETTLAVGEIKSIIQKEDDLFLALKKLADIKRYRLDINSPTIIKKCLMRKNVPYSPKNLACDQIFTFLICEKLKFNTDNIENKIDSAYSALGVDKDLRHNMILSINDGLLLYFNNEGKSFQYPVIGKENFLKNRFIEPDKKNELIHFKYFCNYFFMGLISTTVLYPELTEYLKDSFVGGSRRDQT